MTSAQATSVPAVHVRPDVVDAPSEDAGVEEADHGAVPVTDEEAGVVTEELPELLL